MDDGRPRRSLADDPGFLDSLAELDRGLPTHPAAPEASPYPPPPGGVPGRRPPADIVPPRAEEFGHPPETRPGTARPPQIAPKRREPPSPPHEPSPHETFYGLNTAPFATAADPRFLYHAASHDRAIDDLLAAIRRHDGVAVVIGRSGMGKTTLCRALIDQLDRGTLTSLLGNPLVSVDELIKILLVDFGVVSSEDLRRGPLMQAPRQKLSETLRTFLSSLPARQASAVLIVDDAHRLSNDALEYLGALTDALSGARAVDVVLVGEAVLLGSLQRGELNQLAQRAAVRCELGPLQLDELPGYVTHRVAIAGTSARVEFDEAAFARLFDVSGGVPRTVNLVCERALMLGYARSASLVEAHVIEDAAADLGLQPGRVERRDAVQWLVAIAAVIILMLGGAAAALFVFRDNVSRVLEAWQSVPPPPASPARRLPLPLTPPPPPE